MQGERPSLTRIQHETRRLDVATSIPHYVLAPLIADVWRRQGDEAIVVLDSAERPSITAVDPSSALIAVVQREALHEALGRSVFALRTQKAGHVPFVIIDRHGTTVVFIEVGPTITSPGGSA